MSYALVKELTGHIFQNLVLLLYKIPVLAELLKKKINLPRNLKIKKKLHFIHFGHNSYHHMIFPSHMITFKFITEGDFINLVYVWMLVSIYKLIKHYFYPYIIYDP